MSRDDQTEQEEKIIVIVDAELEDLIPGFLETWQEELWSVSKALEKGDYETIRKLGHEMKGIGCSCGFDAVTELGDDLEKAAKAKAWEVIAKTSDRLSCYLERVEVVFV
jgi:HPt (histidine-containing phosphotransfer) domain-containing protein